MGILMEIFYGNLMGILMMDSLGWPYDSSDCLLFTLLQCFAVFPGKCSGNARDNAKGSNRANNQLLMGSRDPEHNTTASGEQ